VFPGEAGGVRRFVKRQQLERLRGLDGLRLTLRINVLYAERHMNRWNDTRGGIEVSIPDVTTV